MKKKTTDEFIHDAKIKHGSKYNYDFVNYSGNKSKIKIICPIHGEFEQRPNDHLNGRGCYDCSGVKRNTTESFIKKVNDIHSCKYDYSLVDYKNNRTRIKIICPIHGVFEQKAINHINGYGCSKCGVIKSVSDRVITTSEFIEKSINIHGNKYDYSLVNYINSSTKVKIICSIHGEFEQRPNIHILSKGCPKCSKTYKLTNNDFIEKSKIIHGDKYNYSLINYINYSTKIDIICFIHGKFKQRPNDHLKGSGCPKCNQSKGELTINKILSENNILFIEQKTFNNCKDKRLLKFDFYLPDYNTCVEYDGMQHFVPIKKWGGDENLIIIQKRDNIKNDYCIENNIKLIRIRYDDDIKTMLNEFITIV